MQRKLLGIINVDLDATAQLLIIQGRVKNLKTLYKYKDKYLRFSFDSPSLFTQGTNLC